jgi:hypothetical protein
MPRARPIVCIAPSGRLSRADQAAIAARVPGAALSVRSISGYCAAPGADSRILICPAGSSVARDLAFLRRAAERLLWPSPSSDFRDAIAGLRAGSARPRLARHRTAAATRGAGETVSALLLEGRVGPARMRALLASRGPREWIVETPGHVELPARWAPRLARAGVRWSALEPVELVALYAAPALARASSRWRTLLPPRTPVWIRPSARPPRRRRS